MKTLYVNNNGNLIKNENYTIETASRGYLYGDGLIESIRVLHGKPINVNIHITRVLDGMRVLKMKIPDFYTPAFFEDKFQNLLQQSEIDGGGKIRLSIDREKGGTYHPEGNNAVFFIEAYPLDANEFSLNEKGKEMELYTKVRKENNIFANFKTKNCLANIMGAIEAEEKGLDDVFLTNAKGGILESTNSNLFVVSNGILYTPGLEEGCVGGTMRMTIINLALENGIKVYESTITPQNLLIADEIFLTNAIRGITWVGRFRTKEYDNKIAQHILQLLQKNHNKQ